MASAVEGFVVSKNKQIKYYRTESQYFKKLN